MSSDPWSGLGSSIVGGLIGAVMVVAGVWVAHRLDLRAQLKVDRERALAGLIVHVSNMRDSVVHARQGLIGRFELFPLRNELYLARPLLDGYQAYDETWSFYKACLNFRGEAREFTGADGRWPEARLDEVRAYLNDLDNSGDQLIEALQRTQMGRPNQERIQIRMLNPDKAIGTRARRQAVE